MPDLAIPQAIPRGIIIEWSGTIATIPTGFALCDGTKGTPNLLSKFIRGAPAATEAGTTGGSDTHTLTTSELAVHSHSFGESVHGHSTGLNRGSSGSGSGVSNSGGSLVGSPGAGATSSSSASASINNAGSGSAHENRPAYFELAYIMKT